MIDHVSMPGAADEDLLDVVREAALMNSGVRIAYLNRSATPRVFEKLAAELIGQRWGTDFQYFDDEAAAEAWLFKDRSHPC